MSHHENLEIILHSATSQTSSNHPIQCHTPDILKSSHTVSHPGHFHIILHSTTSRTSSHYPTQGYTSRTHLLICSMVQSTSWEANWFAVRQEIPRRFITALTSVRHLSLSWTSPIESIYPHPTSWRSILILSTHLRLGLPSGLLPSGFPTKTLYTPLSSPIRATCPAHLILLDFITRTILGEEYKSFSSSLCSLLYSPVTSSLRT